MPRWKYIGDKIWLGGWLNPGDVIEAARRPGADFMEIVDWKAENTENTDIAKATRQVLLSKSMKELRMIGNQFGAKDTDKAELVNEILNEMGKRGDYSWV